MTIIQFPSKKQDSQFFKDIMEDGYHIFSLKNAEIPDYYPNEFPDYPGVVFKDLEVGDEITVRVFFVVGNGDPVKVEGGYLDLEVKEVYDDSVLAVILTPLSDGLALGAGGSLEIFQEEILYKLDITEQ